MSLLLSFLCRGDKFACLLLNTVGFQQTHMALKNTDVRSHVWWAQLQNYHHGDLSLKLNFQSWRNSLKLKCAAWLWELQSKPCLTCFALENKNTLLKVSGYVGMRQGSMVDASQRDGFLSAAIFISLSQVQDTAALSIGHTQTSWQHWLCWASEQQISLLLRSCSYLLLIHVYIGVVLRGTEKWRK